MSRAHEKIRQKLLSHVSNLRAHEIKLKHYRLNYQAKVLLIIIINMFTNLVFNALL